MDALKNLAAAYDQISKIGFPFVMFLALVGSYYGVWYWGAIVRQWKAEQEARELATVTALRAEIAEIKAAAAQREAAQQGRIDQLFDRMIEAAGLLEKSARQVSR